MALASLGLVSPGAATDSVTPIFSSKKTDDPPLVTPLRNGENFTYR